MVSPRLREHASTRTSIILPFLTSGVGLGASDVIVSTYAVDVDEGFHREYQAIRGRALGTPCTEEARRLLVSRMGALLGFV